MIGFTHRPATERLSAGWMTPTAMSIFYFPRIPIFLKQKPRKLEGLNNQRKIAVDGVYHAARKMLEDEPALTNYAAFGAGA